MQGVLNVSQRPAKIKIRVTSKDTPPGAEVVLTDFMLQPGSGVSGWQPHVTEMPWSAGVSA